MEQGGIGMEGKQKRYRRMKKAGIGLEVIGIRAGLILYWIPKPVEKEFYVSTLEGEVIPVELHLNWQPLIFSPSKLKGYIVLDNEYFYSPFGYRFDGKVYPAYVRGGGYSFPFKEKWEIKWDGDQFSAFSAGRCAGENRFGNQRG
jgi:hypothetical protein